MLKEVNELTRIQLLNLFRFNEVRYTKDRKKKNRFIATFVIFAYLFLMMAVYIGVMTASLISIGSGDIVPMYLSAIAGIIILFFQMLKASSIIFQKESYEMLTALPFSKGAIVKSRFLYLYFGDFITSLVVMVPGYAVYIAKTSPSFSFIILSFIGIFLIPLFPLALAIIISTLITGITSKMKNKSILQAVFSILFVMVILVFNQKASMSGGNINEEMIGKISAVLTSKIKAIYPLAFWYSNGTTGKNILEFLLFAVVSIASFLAVLFIVEKNFENISRRLQSSFSKKNYKMEELKTKSPVIALLQKDIKRYLASSIYVTNTILGYIFMIALSVALLFMGEEKIESLISIPNILNKALPFVLAILASLAPITEASVSIEGKQWWIAKTAPISTKDLVNSKLLLNFTFAIPSYIISEIILLFAVKTTLVARVFLIIIPLLYIIFSSLVGLFANLKFPTFDWENETQIAKQGTPVFIAMISAFVSTIIPAVIAFKIDERYENITLLAISVVIFGFSAIIYNKCKKINILEIE